MLDAVFLDRDGVINEEVNYLIHPKDLRLIPGAARAVRSFNERSIPVIVVTNQAGVARGYYKESQITPLHEELSRLLGKEGAHVDRYYYCPHHPDGKGEYKKICDCRKPMPGLLLQAAKEMGLDLTRCAIVGDKASDIGAGHAVGAKSVLVMTGYGEKEWKTWKEDFKPTHVAKDLLTASAWLSNPQ